MADPQAKVQAALMCVVIMVVSVGCRNPFFNEDGPPPPPNHVAAVEAACYACTPAEAVHQCLPHPPGTRLCQSIPAARVGDAMIVCGRGTSSQGNIGNLRWSSSHPEVATVTPAHLTVTHCLNEVANATLEAQLPGTTTLTLQESNGGAIVSTALATVTVAP